jgi:hypothetical protein
MYLCNGSEHTASKYRMIKNTDDNNDKFKDMEESRRCPT